LVTNRDGIQETTMRKGKHRRHREAREMKVLGGAAADRALGIYEESEAESCEECGRRPHAEWCRAEEE